MIVVVQQYQTIWDIALQHAGSVEAAFAILEANSKESTTLLAGESLVIPEIFNRKIAAFFANEFAIASAIEPLGQDGYVPPVTQTCDPATVTLFDLPFLIISAGESINIKVLKPNDDPAPIISSEEGNIIVDWPNEVECPSLEEVISSNDWAAIFPFLSDQQLYDGRVEYLVKYENGTEIASGHKTPAENLLVTVIDPVVPSGIAYFEPNDMAYPLPSAADYDDGWRVSNGIFRRSRPSYPLYNQRLDLSAADPFNTLLHPNKYGSFARYTRIGGSTTPWNGVEPIFDIEDHLTGRCLRRSSPSFLTWNNALNTFAAQGFYLPSQQELFTLRNMTSADINIMGITGYHLSGHNGWSGTTDQANTLNAIRLASSYPTASSLKTTTLRATIYIKRIED